MNRRASILSLLCETSDPITSREFSQKWDLPATALGVATVLAQLSDLGYASVRDTDRGKAFKASAKGRKYLTTVPASQIAPVSALQRYEKKGYGSSSKPTTPPPYVTPAANIAIDGIASLIEEHRAQNQLLHDIYMQLHNHINPPEPIEDEQQEIDL